MSSLAVVTDPATEPVTMGEARAHLRVSTTDDDGLVAGYLLAARHHVEHYLARALINRTYDLKIDWTWPTDGGDNVIAPPRPPLVSVTSITYTDTSGNPQTLASNQYQVSPGYLYGRIVEAYGVVWPTVRNMLDAITVRFVAGYGASTENVPDAIRQAILLMLGHFYENRSAVMAQDGLRVAIVMPLAVESLLSPYRVDVL